MRRLVFPILLAAVLALALAGCSSPQPAGKRYQAQGEVKAVDPAAKSATIAFGKIGDWMDPMTMEYAVKPDAAFQKLHVGDRISATVVVVTDAQFYVTDVKVLPKS